MKIKSKLILLTVNFLFILIITSCHHPNEKTRNLHDHSKKQYTCSMHPEVIEDEPGDCKKCDMTLIKKTKGKNSEESHEGHNH